MTTDVTPARLANLGTATLHEAQDRRGALGPAIRALWRGAIAAGRARTVSLRAGDNLGIHRALDEAAPGEILVAAGPHSSATFGFWGEVLTEYAIARGVAGLVTNFAVRDLDAIERLRFPIFGPSVSLQGTIKRHVGQHQIPVVIGQAVVRPGDWMVGDLDGCVVIRSESAIDICLIAEKRSAREDDAIRAIRGGASTTAALGLGRHD